MPSALEQLVQDRERRDQQALVGTLGPAWPSPPPGQIFKAIPEVMKEVGAVSKGRKNQQQNYQFRGIDDVYAAVQLVLAKHGVFVVPEVLRDTILWDERTSKSGGTLMHLRVVIRHRFYAADGSSVYADTFGEAMDSGDKSCNKAMSVAMKYALIEALCIPTTEPKDPEDDSPEVLPRPSIKKEPAPERDFVGSVRSLALKHPPEGLGMSPQHAQRWLKKYFGKESATELTPAQAHDAFLLLTCRLNTPDLYPARLEQFFSEKRVLTGDWDPK